MQQRPKGKTYSPFASRPGGFKMGISRAAFDTLQQSVPHADKTADQFPNAEVHHGPVESLEEGRFKWLRRRRG